MQISLCRVRAGEVEQLTCQLPAGSTVGDALRAVGWAGTAASAGAAVGIFGVRADLDRVLQPGDRVECYHPLPQDPKERRRRRAQRPKPCPPR